MCNVTQNDLGIVTLTVLIKKITEIESKKIREDFKKYDDNCKSYGL